MSHVNYEAIKAELAQAQALLDNTKEPKRLNREELAIVKAKLWEIMQQLDGPH